MADKIAEVVPTLGSVNGVLVITGPREVSIVVGGCEGLAVDLVQVADSAVHRNGCGIVGEEDLALGDADGVVVSDFIVAGIDVVVGLSPAEGDVVVFAVDAIASYAMGGDLSAADGDVTGRADEASEG